MQGFYVFENASNIIVLKNLAFIYEYFVIICCVFRFP